ncbi:unnamed protein product [Cladocopium goreaui]|uniref:Glutathione peroxidase n=1 Tax=Cladocopium goreaui TaxID=2562237 RepID=A0A9P1D7S8_9DINO|nr:unnamed protein product [Cladocopium goreaui]
MHPYHHAATVQYGQPQQRQTYIHSVAGQPVQMQQPMQPMQPQIQGYRAPASGLAPSGAQYTFYGASNVPATPNPAMWQPGMMPPSRSFPGLAAHPLPPEHSIGPSEAGAAAVTAVPEAQEESSSEYESDSDASAAASPSAPAEASHTASPESPAGEDGEAAVTGVPPPTSAGELDAGVIAGMPPSMTISQVPSVQSERQEKDSFTNVNYQTHDPRAPVKEDVNLQTRIDAKLINEAPVLPTRSKITTDEHLDQVLFPRGFRVDRTLPSKRKGLSPGALGKGAFGVVYKGFKRDGEEVALKVSENATATQPMLDQEINILKMLDHPSIVKFYDAFVDKESDWMIIAMELVSGGDLLSSLTGEPQVYEERGAGPSTEGFFSLSAKNIDGQEIAFSSLRRPVLVTNVELNKEVAGLTIMAFPCNQFGAQEPGTASEIKSFVKEQGASVDDPDSGFLLMEKVEVNGPGTHPVYAFLKSSSHAADIKWNFASYFLVTRSGAVQHLPGGRNGPASMRGAIDEALVRPMVFHIACALAHAHELGVVHRDLKPENILLRQGDRFPKVADFGLSRSLRASEVAMTVAGTPTYMAPEIQDPRLPYDFPADVYSLGCILTDMMDKAFCCSWYAKAMQGNHEKMRKRWPEGCVPHHFSRELKEMQGKMIGQAPGLRPSCYQICKDLLSLADEKVLPNALWQERPKLPTGPPLQKMLSPELAADIAGRGGYGVGVNVMVLVNGQWLPGKAQRDAQQMAAMFGMLESSMAILSTLDFYKPRLRLLNWEGTIKKY